MNKDKIFIVKYGNWIGAFISVIILGFFYIVTNKIEDNQRIEKLEKLMMLDAMKDMEHRLQRIEKLLVK